jgi:hypothetical protein
MLQWPEPNWTSKFSQGYSINPLAFSMVGWLTVHRVKAEQATSLPLIQRG